MFKIAGSNPAQVTKRSQVGIVNAQKNELTFII